LLFAIYLKDRSDGGQCWREQLVGQQWRQQLLPRTIHCYSSTGAGGEISGEYILYGEYTISETIT